MKSFLMNKISLNQRWQSENYKVFFDAFSVCTNKIQVKWLSQWISFILWVFESQINYDSQIVASSPTSAMLGFCISFPY